MGDLPSGPALLALARDVLLNDLLPLLPESARLDARLVANAMAIAEREAVEGDGQRTEIIRNVETLYGARREPGEGDLLRRFADDLRIGAFEASPQRDRAARDILWRLTIARLRQANPRFLAANGLS